MVVFSGMELHYVPPQINGYNRIVMSGNLRKYSEELEGEPFFTNNGILNNLQRLNNEGVI